MGLSLAVQSSWNRLPRPGARTLVRICAVVTALLIVDALLRERGTFDYWLINAVRTIEFPGDERLMKGVSRLTGTEGAVLAWFLLLALFLVLRRWLNAVALGVIPLAGLLSESIQNLIDRPRPDFSRIHGLEGAVRAAEDQDFASFPSGHVLGAILLYGLLFALAGELRNRPLRWALRAVFVAIVVLTGVARVWLGSHWAGDVVTAFTLGGLLLGIQLILYRRAAPHVAGAPLISARAMPHNEAAPHAHALTSLILFRGDEAWKVYSPGLVPQAIYWLSFQAPFPYANNEAALQAAIHRRNLAGRLTEYWYGERRVAKALRVDEFDGRPALVSRFVAGREPSHETARPFLQDLAGRFDAAGLPTWQIDPRQPRSFGNLIETPDGTLMVIDLESGLVSPLASPRAWLRAIRRRIVPIFDDMYFDITRSYVEREAAAMRETLGWEWYERLVAELDLAEQDAIAWHASEPRVWARMLTWTAIALQPGSWGRRLQVRAEMGEQHATRWLEESINRWADEGRLSAAESEELRQSVESPQFQAVLPHFGVHLMIGVALRFPFGSIARVAYTGGNLLGATLLMLVRRRSREHWRRARSIHSPLVLVVAALPGIGTLSYLTSKPVRSQGKLARVALDAAGEKVPWHLYERIGLRRLVAGGEPHRVAGPASAAR